jgi:hypothetical protein
VIDEPLDQFLLHRYARRPDSRRYAGCVAQKTDCAFRDNLRCCWLLRRGKQKSSCIATSWPTLIVTLRRRVAPAKTLSSSRLGTRFSALVRKQVDVKYSSKAGSAGRQKVDVAAGPIAPADVPARSATFFRRRSGSVLSVLSGRQVPPDPKCSSPRGRPSLARAELGGGGCNRWAAGNMLHRVSRKCVTHVIETLDNSVILKCSDQSQ